MLLLLLLVLGDCAVGVCVVLGSSSGVVVPPSSIPLLWVRVAIRLISIAWVSAAHVAVVSRQRRAKGIPTAVGSVKPLGRVPAATTTTAAAAMVHAASVVMVVATGTAGTGAAGRRSEIRPWGQTVVLARVHGVCFAEAAACLLLWCRVEHWWMWLLLSS